jgi:hypothetical protein
MATTTSLLDRPTTTAHVPAGRGPVRAILTDPALLRIVLLAAAVSALLLLVAAAL